MRRPRRIGRNALPTCVEWRERGLAKLDKVMAGPNPQAEIRALTNAALCHLAFKDNIPLGEKYLKLALDKQNMDPTSPDYGDIPWDLSRNVVHDKNGIEFAMCFVGPILMRYSDELSPDFKQEVLRHASAAIAAIDRHQVPVSYTNIYLMKLANLLLLGQATGNTAAVTEGKANLDTWLAFTQANGVSEYDSPTYSYTQLQAINDAYINSPDEATRAKIKLGLDYMWTDLSANFFPGRGYLSGPRSRSYDFVWQKGTLLHEYYVEGLTTLPAGIDYLGGIWLTASMPNAYHPSQSILDLAHIPVRVVEQRFGAAPGMDRYNYITPDFAVGSASHYYGPQDMELGVELASTKNLPVIWVVPDIFDSPFGTVRTQDKSGHVKPKHIKVAISAVQDKGTVLALLDLGPDSGNAVVDNVATDITIPMEADGVYFNGQKINAKGQPFEMAAHDNSIVYVREGKAAVALRLFGAGGAGGQQPSYWFKYDGTQTAPVGEAKTFEGGRLVVYHYRGEKTKLAHAAIRAGVLIQAATCADDAAFAAFVKNCSSTVITQDDKDGIWSASVDANGKTLAAGLDLAKEAIAFRKRDGKDVAPPVFSVNGQEIASKIFLPASPAEAQK